MVLVLYYIFVKSPFSSQRDEKKKKKERKRKCGTHPITILFRSPFFTQVLSGGARERGGLKFDQRFINKILSHVIKLFSVSRKRSVYHIVT